MLYQPKMLTPVGVIATVSASSKGNKHDEDDLSHMSWGHCCIVCFVSEFAMQLSAPYIMLCDFNIDRDKRIVRN